MAGEADGGAEPLRDVVESESEELLSEHIYNTILKAKPEDLRPEIVFREHRSKGFPDKKSKFIALVERLERENRRLRKEVGSLEKRRKRIDDENGVLAERLNDVLTKE
jgi:hypothetical protein